MESIRQVVACDRITHPSLWLVISSNVVCATSTVLLKLLPSPTWRTFMSSQLTKWSCVYPPVPPKNCMSCGDQLCDVVSLGVVSGKKHEHSSDLWHHKMHNSLVSHAKTHSCYDVKVLHAGLWRRMRTVEATHTTAGELTNHREGCLFAGQAWLMLPMARKTLGAGQSVSCFETSCKVISHGGL